MENHKSKIFFFILSLCLVFSAFSSGIIFYTKILTEVVIYLDNGLVKKVNVAPARPFKMNAFFAGFKKIRWTDPYDGSLHEVSLKIKGYKGWYDVFIERGYIILHSEKDETTIHIHATHLGSLSDSQEHEQSDC